MALLACLAVVGCRDLKQGDADSNTSDGDTTNGDGDDGERVRCETLQYYQQLTEPAAPYPSIDDEAHGPQPTAEFPADECSVDGTPSGPPPCDGPCFVTEYCAVCSGNGAAPWLTRTSRLPGFRLQSEPQSVYDGETGESRKELGLLDVDGNQSSVRFDRHSSRGWREDPQDPWLGLSLTKKQDKFGTDDRWLTKYDLATGQTEALYVSADTPAFDHKLAYVGIVGDAVLWDFWGQVCKLDGQGGEYLSACGSPELEPCEPLVYLDHMLTGLDVFYANGLRYVPSEDKVYPWAVQPYDPEVDEVGEFPLWNYNYYNGSGEFVMKLAVGTLVADDTIACYNIDVQQPFSPESTTGYGGAVLCFDGNTGERLLFWRPPGYDVYDSSYRNATVLLTDSQSRLVFAPTSGNQSPPDPEPIEYHDIWRWDPITDELEHLYADLPSFVPYDLIPGATPGEPDSIVLSRTAEPTCIETLALPL